MLSSRGALNMRTMMEQAVSTRPRTAKSIITVPEMQRVWAATCTVLRAQLLLGNPCSIFKHSCAFWYKQQHVVTDGSTKYYRRVPCFGFNQQFATTFSLDSIIEREDLKTSFSKLPMEYIAGEARLPAEQCATILNELFLYIGEALFRGKMLSIEFADVCTVLVKKERANINFHQEFLEDVFAIDSRKWPMAVREVALKTGIQCGTPRPSSSHSRPSSARPRSASSRPATGASSSSPPQPLPPRPSFVSAASGGKLFRELQRQQPRKLPNSKRPGSSKENPLKAVKALQPQALASSDPNVDQCPSGKKVLPMPDNQEEESIYSVLAQSPHRMQDVAESPAQHQQYADDMDDDEDEGDAVAEANYYYSQQQQDELDDINDAEYDDEDEDMYPSIHQQQQQQEDQRQVAFDTQRPASSQSRPATGASQASARPRSAGHKHTDVFFLDETPAQPTHFGRKRIEPASGALNDIRGILMQKPSSKARQQYHQQLHRNHQQDHVTALMHQ